MNGLPVGVTTDRHRLQTMDTVTDGRKGMCDVQIYTYRTPKNYQSVEIAEIFSDAKVKCHFSTCANTTPVSLRSVESHLLPEHSDNVCTTFFNISIILHFLHGVYL